MLQRAPGIARDSTDSHAMPQRTPGNRERLIAESCGYQQIISLVVSTAFMDAALAIDDEYILSDLAFSKELYNIRQNFHEILSSP
ncbi:hypothetical protein [Paenibacillus radicis (ex Xue et al. 2023)]|uniref:Uncharacterized protein n=1 Tax=Paenibacillus radicis (ex Xue et al. 2023) TaxID=2972489 RepID=A0ABT1YCA6_9BACL|nr:hypothetical protein [Paenibacillus radicis (ex Xue et al. 2023)]MCR8630044.1 hypothetical protein [Paenibacillus radicis (ex Xue et al. 2023)]